MKDSQKQMYRIDHIALKHTGLEHTQFDNTAGKVAERHIGHSHIARITALGGGIEEVAVKSLLQLCYGTAL